MNGERGWRRSARASGRGLLLALESVAGIPLFLVTLFCLVIIPAGAGPVPARRTALRSGRDANRRVLAVLTYLNA